ncbi:hypothetical protein HDV05_005468 [Chytridiales sp. JEL 0842]|nr:hypothetical protein HDV05_005468 [Chytridiales sp. JEL 0842]
MLALYNYALFVSLLVSSVTAWGKFGHPATGEMGQRLLSRRAQNMVANLLDPEFNGEISGDTSIWADNIRRSRSRTGPWHYISNMAPAPQSCGYSRADCAGRDCVVGAITDQTQILLDNNCEQSTETTEALQFLVHFLGDIAQPLHNCQRDRGGNEASVKWGRRTTNFHAIHDTDIPVKRGKEVDAFTSSEYATYLLETYMPQSGDYVSRRFTDIFSKDSANMLRSVVAMSTEANALNCKDSAFWTFYDEDPDQDFSAEYYENTKMFLEEQMAKAGFRLAAWLNNIADACANGVTAKVAQAANATTPTTNTTTTTTITTEATAPVSAKLPHQQQLNNLIMKLTDLIITTLVAFSAAAVPRTAFALPTNITASCFSAKNVMTIIFENQDYSKVMRDRYFGTTLPAKGFLLTNIQPNYIAMTAGDTLGVTGSEEYNLNSTSIVDLLEEKGLSWKAYQQDYPGSCFTELQYKGYFRKHNPLISFTSVSENPERCSKIVNASELDVDARNGNLPNYMFYTPNNDNNSHDTTIAYASRWLKSFLEPKLVEPAYKDTLFVVMYDESLSDTPNSIYTVLLGKGILGPNQRNNTKFTHYSYLAMIEKNFGLGNLGRNDAVATPIPLRAPLC